MSKSDILGFAGGDNRPTSEHDRILFENDEVGVAHSIVHFANDSDSEAVLSFMRSGWPRHSMEMVPHHLG